MFRSKRRLQGRQADNPEAKEKPTWVGDAFKIRYQAQARMPWLECSYPYPEPPPDMYQPRAIPGCNCAICQSTRTLTKTGAPATILNHDEIPKVPSEHDIAYWSKGSLIIKSPHLMLAVKDLVKHWPGLSKLLPTSDPDWEAEIPYPYSLLLHHYREIEASLSKPAEMAPEAPVTKHGAKEADNEKEEDKMEVDIGGHEAFKVEKDPTLANHHLTTLHRYLKPIFESKVAPCRKALEEPVPMASYDMLWYIFRPGVTVYVVDQWTPWYTAVVEQTETFKSAVGLTAEYTLVSMWYLSSDGARIARCRCKSSRT